MKAAKGKLKSLIIMLIVISMILGMFPDLGIQKAYAIVVWQDEDVWIDTDGEVMSKEQADNWGYMDGVALEYEDDPDCIRIFFSGEIKNGEITTKVPAIINGKPVTSMEMTFSNRYTLEVAPVIPSTVTNMSGTFNYCTRLFEAPEIPNGVTNLNDTFNNTLIEKAPEIPDSVIYMDQTFYNCKNITEAPKIPSSVISMRNTFSGCNGLTKAPEMADTGMVS